MRRLCNCLDSLAGKKQDSRGLRFIYQAIGDGLRRIGHRKHPAVLYRFETDATFFEPRHRVAERKSVERRNESALTARVTFAHRARIKAGVRDVASASAGNAHLRQ